MSWGFWIVVGIEISHTTAATTMPTTIQNPQLMSSPFLCPFRLRGDSAVLVVDHHGSGQLVVPALPALVEGDPQESPHQQRRDEEPHLQIHPAQYGGCGNNGRGEYHPGKHGNDVREGPANQ